MKKWVKIPGPGQFRGEGDWLEINENDVEEVETWRWHRETQFLPTAESEEKPK